VAGSANFPCPLTEPDPQLRDRLLDLEPPVAVERRKRGRTRMWPDPFSMGDPAIRPCIRRPPPMAARLFSRGQTRRNVFG
jgi:hypothetical protein